MNIRHTGITTVPVVEQSGTIVQPMEMYTKKIKTNGIVHLVISFFSIFVSMLQGHYSFGYDSRKAK